MPAARRTPTGTHRTASESGAETRDRLQAAARACLRQDGIAGVSARAIARHGDLNQALVFYHFGSVDGLLQAVARTDAERRALLYAERLAGRTFAVRCRRSGSHDFTSVDVERVVGCSGGAAPAQAGCSSGAT